MDFSDGFRSQRAARKMAQPHHNQRYRKDGNRVDVEKQEILTDPETGGNDKLKTIEILNSDCLENVFKFLPVVDLFRVQRVCKDWKSVSLNMCRRITRLDMSRNFWGVSSDDNIHIDFGILVRVLNICGPKLQHIGFSNDENNYPVEYRRIHVESDKKVWIMIQSRCPAITSIDFGQSRSAFALKFVSHSFKDLTYFKMKEIHLPKNSLLVYETQLCHLFANNENLKRVDFSEVTLKTDCLTKLNPDNLVELNLEKCMIEDMNHLVTALKALKKLQKLRMTRCSCLSEIWLNFVLEALTSISDSLKYLDYYLYNPVWEIIDANYIGGLTNLEYLSIAGESIVGVNLLTVIGKCCEKLKTLQIHDCSMIGDNDFEYISQHPELKNLYLDNLPNLTDKSLANMMSIENLEIHRCSQFKDHGILNLIRNSNSIRILKIFHCKNISEGPIIEEAERCTNNNLELTINNSETSRDYFEEISKLLKSNGKVKKVVRKICVDCFLAQGQHQNCSLCCNVVESNF